MKFKNLPNLPEVHWESLYASLVACRLLGLSAEHTILALFHSIYYLASPSEQEGVLAFIQETKQSPPIVATPTVETRQ